MTAGIARSAAAGGADAGEFDDVLDIGEAVAVPQDRRPAFHGRRGHRDAAPAAPADEVVLVVTRMADPEQLTLGWVAGCVRQPCLGEHVQSAVNGGQPDPPALSGQPRVQRLRGDEARMGGQAAQRYRV